MSDTMSWLHLSGLTVPVDAGLREVIVIGGGRNTIRILVRPAGDLPFRSLPVAPGRDVPAIGAWLGHGIAGTPLGPSKNGMPW